MSEPVASARNLSKRFGTKDALIDITAEIEQGDVIGVLGKNGAGKTTLLEVLLGFSPPSAGTAMIFGEDSLRLSEAAKARIGFVPQQDELLGMLSGKQQVAIGAVFHKRWDHALIDRLLVDWEVPTDRRIHTLSVGERQKLSVPQGVEVAIIIYPVGALTAIVLAMLVFTGQPNWIWIGLPLLSGFMQWMSAGGPAHLREAGVSLPSPRWAPGSCSRLGTCAPVTSAPCCGLRRLIRRAPRGRGELPRCPPSLRARWRCACCSQATCKGRSRNNC